MRYFVGAELGVANLIQRHFEWSANALWFEEIPNARDPEKTLFMLGGKDEIVYSEVRLFPYSIGIDMSECVAACKEISELSWCSQEPLV